MKLRIEIDKSCGRNVHIVLRGIAGDGAGFDDPEMFIRYVEVCKAFGERHDPRNQDVFDIIRAGDRPLAASAI